MYLVKYINPKNVLDETVGQYAASGQTKWLSMNGQVIGSNARPSDGKLAARWASVCTLV